MWSFLSSSILFLIFLGIPYLLRSLLWRSVEICESFDDLRILGLDFHLDWLILVLVLMQILCVRLVHSKVNNSFNALILGND